MEMQHSTDKETCIKKLAALIAVVEDMEACLRNDGVFIDSSAYWEQEKGA